MLTREKSVQRTILGQGLIALFATIGVILATLLYNQIAQGSLSSATNNPSSIGRVKHSYQAVEWSDSYSSYVPIQPYISTVNDGIPRLDISPGNTWIGATGANNRGQMAKWGFFPSSLLQTQLLAPYGSIQHDYTENGAYGFIGDGSDQVIGYGGGAPNQPSLPWTPNLWGVPSNGHSTAIPSGWVLVETSGVNNDGPISEQGTVVGFGLQDIILLSPLPAVPEPANFALFLGGLGTLWIMTRLSRRLPKRFPLVLD